MISGKQLACMQRQDHMELLPFDPEPKRTLHQSCREAHATQFKIMQNQEDEGQFQERNEPQVDDRPVQQAVSGRLGLILRELNGSTCWTVPAHLKDGPSRASPWTPTDWPGMAHKPGGLAVPAGRADRPCRRAVPVGRVDGPCQRAVPAGLAHIKFCFVIKSIFFLNKSYI